MSESFRFQEETVSFLPGETVLDSLLRNEIPVEYGCKNGSCQSCLLRSQTPPPAKAQEGLADALKKADCFLACKCPADSVTSVEPVSDDVLPNFPAKVILRDMLSSDVLRLRVELPPEFEFTPGMFVRLVTPDGLKRSYSIANSRLSADSYLEFHIRLLSDGTMSQYLAQSDEPTLCLQGPFGNCTYRNRNLDQPIVFIGSGTGLAPIYAVLTDALSQHHQGKLSLFFGGATFSSLYFLEELHRVAQEYPNVEVHFCSDLEDSDKRTFTGSPLDVALSTIGSFTGCRVYTCGHPELVKATKRKVFLAGANMGDIYSDSFDNQTVSSVRPESFSPVR